MIYKSCLNVEHGLCFAFEQLRACMPCDAIVFKSGYNENKEKVSPYIFELLDYFDSFSNEFIIEYIETGLSFRNCLNIVFFIIFF